VSERELGKTLAEVGRILFSSILEREKFLLFSKFSATQNEFELRFRKSVTFSDLNWRHHHSNLAQAVQHVQPEAAPNGQEPVIRDIVK